MPDVSSSRVKNTGYGEIFYSTANSAVSGNASVSGNSTTALGILSVDGLNLGDGFDLFAGAIGTRDIILEFNTIKAGNGITISQNGGILTINSTANGTGSSGNAASDGFHLSLGNVAVYNGGSWTPGAVPLTDNTPVSLATDLMNEVLGLLVPAAPPAFPNSITLFVTNSSGSVPFLASGVADHAATGLTAGTPVTRVTGGIVSTNTFANIGPANSGHMQLLLNGGAIADHIMNGTGDVGAYNGMIISNEQSYPVNQPGFYKSFSVGVSGATALSGINSIRLNHTAASATNIVFFVDDTLTATPTISAASIAQSSSGVVSYSSSVPHYGTGATLVINASLSNIAGQTYYGDSDPFTVLGTNGIINPQAFAYSNLSIATPIPQNTLSSIAISPITVNVDGTTHDVGLVQGVAKNVNGPSIATNLSNILVLVKNGVVPNGKIDELSVPVIDLGVVPNGDNAIRVGGLTSGNQPAGSPSAWSSNAALQTFDAAVVAGVLSNNQTNYSTGYLPVGPDLSASRNIPQYITLSFNRTAVSTFVINVAGTYGGVWIKLPGVSDNSTISPHAVNGWWDATVPYNGAGVPGNASDSSAGCAVGQAMLGSSGSYTITFGPQTSTNANGNTILVRIRLNAGQSITALSFS